MPDAALAGVNTLPSGIVTFVFTDIEGSTRLLRERGEEYGALLDVHHEVLRRCWAAGGGREVNTEGDAFFVAFDDATAAVRTLVAAQRSLAAAHWPGGSPVKVRMGVHTGFARPVDGDYRALAVNQTARVVSTGHGGQIVLTEDTRAHLQDLGDGIVLEPRGRYRVRDFDEPVALYTVSAPDMEAVDTRLRARPAEGHNLVRPTTPLVGREQELTHLRGVVAVGKLVTIVGPAGVGKTRLATELAIAAAASWPDGVWFVELAPLSSPDVIGMAVCSAVGVTVAPGADPWRAALAHLAERSALVVLDNCEHLLDGAAQAAVQLLERCPSLAVVATSRIPLGLRAEHVFRLGGLSGPGEPAVALFLDRADVPEGELERSTVVELCDELDGLPLAIELAAARTVAVAPEEILEQLRKGRSLLASRDPGLPERQRSLDVALDWSDRLLDQDAATMLRALAVFAGTFDLVAAQDAGAGAQLERDRVDDLVWSLVESSLLNRDPADRRRYVMLRSVRAYARARCAGEVADSVTAAVARGYVARLGPERAQGRDWVSAMRPELDNVREIVRVLAAGHDPVRIELAQRLAWSIGFLYDSTDTYRAGITELGQLVALLPEPTPACVGALTMLADLHMRLDEVDAAAPIVARAEALAERVGQPDWDRTAIERSLGQLAARRGDRERSVVLARAALQREQSPRSRSRLYNMLGIALLDSGDLEGALDAFQRELAAATEAGMETFAANANGNLAEVALRLGRRSEAAAYQLAALEMARAMSSPVQDAYACVVAAHLVSVDADWSRAVWLHAAADIVLEDAGIVLYESDREQRATLFALAREALGPEAFESALLAGRSAHRDAAADAATEVLQRAATHEGRDNE